MAKTVLRVLNGILGWIVALLLLSVVAYADFAIWDNYQIYQTAAETRENISLLKPSDDDAAGPGFDELRNINPDVVAWITLEGTEIDDPVVRGEDNRTYLDTNVYGEYSMAGSIFLDSRDPADCSAPYLLIYGHNMDKHQMFGDLAEYKKEDFFKAHTGGTLLLPGQSLDLQVAAVLQIPAGTDEIFNPDRWADGVNGLADYLKSNALLYHALQLDALAADPAAYQVCALATCSDGNTDDRTVLILIRKKDGTAAPGDDPSAVKGDSHSTVKGGGSGDVQRGTSPKTGDTEQPDLWICVIGACAAVIIGIEGAGWLSRRRKRKEGDRP